MQRSTAATRADALCEAEAPEDADGAAAVLLGDDRTLEDLFDADTIYVRTDGVRVGTGAEIIAGLTGEPPASVESPIVRGGDGVLVPSGDDPVLRYARTGLTERCSTDAGDWTDATADGLGMFGAIFGWNCADDCGDLPCSSQGTRLRCVEQ